jgi:hypothetical protein
VIPPRVSVGQDPKEKEPGKPDPSGFSRKSWAETALAAPTAAAETATHAVTEPWPSWSQSLWCQPSWSQSLWCQP